MSENTHDAQLRDELSAIMRNQRVSQAALAREIGVSASALNQYLKGSYAGDNDQLSGKLRLWVEGQLARRTASMPSAPKWVSTPTGEAILGALAYAQIASDVAVIYGGAGLGKTSAIRQHASTSLNVWHVVMQPATSAVVTALEEICAGMGLNETGGAAKLTRAIVKRLKGTFGLLVIDEAQHLSVAALDQIRSLHDATDTGNGAEVGLALVGNKEVYARLTGGNRSEQLSRLYSRVGRRLHVSRSAPGDVTALLEAWGLTDTKCHTLVRQIADRPGALRTVTKVLRLAAMHATAAGEALCCTHVASAWQELGAQA